MNQVEKMKRRRTPRHWRNPVKVHKDVHHNLASQINIWVSHGGELFKEVIKKRVIFTPEKDIQLQEQPSQCVQVFHVYILAIFLIYLVFVLWALQQE